MKNFKMKKSITQKYPAKAESILSSCFVIKPATNNKLEYCEVNRNVVLSLLVNLKLKSNQI